MTPVYIDDRKFREISKISNGAAGQSFIDRRIIKQVVAKDNDQSKDKDDLPRQIDQQTKNDHTHPDREDHLEDNDVKGGIEGPSECDDHRFNEQQPYSS